MPIIFTPHAAELTYCYHLKKGHTKFNYSTSKSFHFRNIYRV